MTVRVRTKLDLGRVIPGIKRKFDREIKGVIVDEVRATIQSGSSPVRGRRNFVKYSDAYAKKKGRFEPVDMEVTGKMLASLRARVIRLGKIAVYFRSRIADYHNKGAGNLPERRLLPTRSGETFKASILNNIVKRVDRIVRAETRKQNR